MGKTVQGLQDYLVAQLRGDYAHAPFGQATADWPAALRGVRPAGCHHAAWQILEHMRIAQWDILEFSRRADHISPDFPSGYWPRSPSPPDEAAWNSSIAQFQRDREAMQRMVADPSADLYRPFPHGTGQTLLKESLTLASHNSYHTGQLMILRQLLGI